MGLFFSMMMAMTSFYSHICPDSGFTGYRLKAKINIIIIIVSSASSLLFFFFSLLHYYYTLPTL